MSELTSAVRNALSGHDLLEVSAQVKNLVCEELASVDPTAEIKRTEYFNHTYVPDIVVEWSGGGPRNVYMRFLNDPRRFEEDLRRIGSDGPVLFDLSAALGESAEEVADEDLDAALESAPTVLLTDTDATEPVRPARTQNLVERLVAANVLRVGRGHLDQHTALRTVESSRAGFDAALAGEPQAVRAAIEAARMVYGLELERRVERSLQLVWWAGGADPEQFPVTLPDDLSLNSDDTREFLRSVFLDSQPIEDNAFWARLADRLDFDTLVSVGEVEDGANFHYLMKHLASRLRLSHAALDRVERRLQADPLFWSLSNQFLTLSGPDWVCRFTPHGNRFSQRRNEGQTIPLVAAAARTAGLRVEEVVIEDANRTLQVRRKVSSPSQSEPASLKALASGLAAAAVRELVIQSGNDLLTVDFDRMMVWSEEDPFVIKLARMAVQLLAAPPDTEVAELNEFLDVAQ